jgi:hypothetical protein
MGYPRHYHSDQRFVRHGLLYVRIAFTFLGLAATSAFTLGDRVSEYRTISFGVTAIAFFLLMVGISLLATLLLPYPPSMKKVSTPGRARLACDVWDDQFDR